MVWGATVRVPSCRQHPSSQPSSRGCWRYGLRRVGRTPAVWSRSRCRRSRSRSAGCYLLSPRGCSYGSRRRRFRPLVVAVKQAQSKYMSSAFGSHTHQAARRRSGGSKLRRRESPDLERPRSEGCSRGLAVFWLCLGFGSLLLCSFELSVFS